MERHKTIQVNTNSKDPHKPCAGNPQSLVDPNVDANVHVHEDVHVHVDASPCSRNLEPRGSGSVHSGPPGSLLLLGLCLRVLGLLGQVHIGMVGPW